MHGHPRRRPKRELRYRSTSIGREELLARRISSATTKKRNAYQDRSGSRSETHTRYASVPALQPRPLTALDNTTGVKLERGSGGGAASDSCLLPSSYGSMGHDPREGHSSPVQPLIKGVLGQGCPTRLLDPLALPIALLAFLFFASSFSSHPCGEDPQHPRAVVQRCHDPGQRQVPEDGLAHPFLCGREGEHEHRERQGLGPTHDKRRLLPLRGTESHGQGIAAGIVTHCTVEPAGHDGSDVETLTGTRPERRDRMRSGTASSRHVCPPRTIPWPRSSESLHATLPMIGVLYANPFRTPIAWARGQGTRHARPPRQNPVKKKKAGHIRAATLSGAREVSCSTHVVSRSPRTASECQTPITDRGRGLRMSAPQRFPPARPITALLPNVSFPRPVCLDSDRTPTVREGGGGEQRADCVELPRKGLLDCLLGPRRSNPAPGRDTASHLTTAGDERPCQLGRHGARSRTSLLREDSNAEGAGGGKSPSPSRSRRYNSRNATTTRGIDACPLLEARPGDHSRLPVSRGRSFVGERAGLGARAGGGEGVWLTQEPHLEDPSSFCHTRHRRQ